MVALASSLIVCRHPDTTAPQLNTIAIMDSGKRILDFIVNVLDNSVMRLQSMSNYAPQIVSAAKLKGVLTPLVAPRDAVD